MNRPKTELRTDVLTGRRVLLAEHRANRPISRSEKSLPYCRDDDPFLEGHEDQTPEERLALRQFSSATDDVGWLIRIIPNRYPAVIKADAQSTTAAGDCNSIPAFGTHDVVVECPDARSRLAELSVVEFARVLFAWQTRIRQIAKATNGAGLSISVFRNEGGGAGASLPHCHSQILATSFLPQQAEARIQRAQSFHNSTGCNLYQDWLASELTAYTRIVQQSDDLVVVCPFAGRVSRHTRFCPALSGERVFEQLTETMLIQLAATVLSTIHNLEMLTGPFPHNMTLILPPVDQPELFPWMLDLLPRSSGIAGFEMMADVDVVTVAPEAVAEHLRTQVLPPAIHEVHEPLCPPGYCWHQ